MRVDATFPALVLILCAQPASARSPEEAPEQKAAAVQGDGLAAFAWMDGEWRGKARVLTPRGPVEIVQTERSGTLLDGRIRLIEGRGYDGSGKLAFNAFGVIAAKPQGGFELRSWTGDAAGTFAIEPTAKGMVWTIAAGLATIRYEAWFEDGKWIETGHRLVPGKPPVEFIRMELSRVGASDWPAAGAIAPR